MTTRVIMPAVLALQSGEAGISGNQILESLPRDPASVFVLLLIVVGAGAVLWFGRPRGSGRGPDQAT